MSIRLASIVVWVSTCWTVLGWGQDPPGPPRLRVTPGGHCATVRALAFAADSKQLFSAGSDKRVEVWNLDWAEQLVHRGADSVKYADDSILWEIARGPLGSIYALACSRPTSDGTSLLAVAGYGARGSIGDILLFDADSRRLHRVFRGPIPDDPLHGHLATVVGLAFTFDGGYLISADVTGKVIAWNLKDSQPKVIREADATQGYGAYPVAVVGSTVLFPDRKDARWRVKQIDLSGRSASGVYPQLHDSSISALAVSVDGRVLASAGAAEDAVLVHDFERPRGQRIRRIEIESRVTSLDFHPKSNELLIGTALTNDASSIVGRWDLESWQWTSRQKTGDTVVACRYSADASRIAYSGGDSHQVCIQRIDGSSNQVVALGGRGHRLQHVAFQQTGYGVGFGWKQGAEIAKSHELDLQQAFEPVTRSLAPVDPDEVSGFIDSRQNPADWEAVKRGTTMVLRRGGIDRASIQIGTGQIRSYCWIKDRDRIGGIAIGTDGEHQIFVVGLDGKILRVMRGHIDRVVSLSCSHDQRLLCSGSHDGTVRFWSLDGLSEQPLWDRWGIKLRVDAANRTLISAVHPAGPLFARGARRQDTIDSISWFVDGRIHQETEALAIVQTLNSLPLDTLVVFHTSRGGERQPAFVRVPAWEPLVTLYVTRDSEWAFWTPHGYYDASISGHELFGWQLNQGIDQQPSFFQADQFFRELERPDVLQHLLESGSVPAAFGRIGEDHRFTNDAIVDQIHEAPLIDIVSVDQNGGKAIVKANIVEQRGRLKSVRGYAGWVAGNQVSRKPAGDDVDQYEWSITLPAAARHLIQVIAQTEKGTIARRQVILNAEPLRTGEQPRIFILCVGVNDYFYLPPSSDLHAGTDARTVLGFLEARSKPFYRLGYRPILLVDHDVNPDRWDDELTQLRNVIQSESLKPDDVLVIYLAGHGILSQQDGRYLFVGHAYDPRTGREDECLSWNSFLPLADLPCTKLVILDTCHAGAIASEAQHLKDAVRPLQASMFLTMTATSINQSALELDNGVGLFANTLLRGLEGAADYSNDETISLDEMVRYLQRVVPERFELERQKQPRAFSRRGAKLQTPTASPERLIEFSAIPLTKSSSH